MINLLTHQTRSAAVAYCDEHGAFGGHNSYWQDADGTWRSCKYTPDNSVRKFWSVRGGGFSNHIDRDARVLTNQQGCTWFLR